ncbi:hypothetical protein BN1318_1670002 [Staphylococcus capitis]|nr:hypothetical protein BN1318_1670002 [Staphylococcus capitis]
MPYMHEQRNIRGSFVRLMLQVILYLTSQSPLIKIELINYIYEYNKPFLNSK